ncbi:beta strand repeat-containing protein [Vulcanococcus limneticus]|uniref:beta strand repeat-containing protein n=1 Tax=Vulcanococcus limneticus TaxID=2170428 RepID=UPI00398BE144
MAFAQSTYIAINNVPISIAGSGLIQALSTLNPNGTGFNVTSATETQGVGTPAVATAQNNAQVGLLFGDAGTSPISIGLNGSVLAAQFANTTASATAADSNATAQATNGFALSGNTNGGGFVGSGPIGGGIIYLGNNGTVAGDNTPGQLAIGGSSAINVFVDNGVRSTATTTTGNALANADPGNAYGIYDTSIKVGGVAGQANLVNVQLDGVTNASASTTTGNATARAGLDDFARNQYAGILHSGFVGPAANSGGLEPLVLSFGAGNTTIRSEVGVPASPGAALVQIGATANTVSGAANATAQADLLGGIYQNGVADFGGPPTSASGLQILIGQVGTVSGKAHGETNATAGSVNGDADALATVDETVGIGDEGVLRGFANPVLNAGSAIKIGQDGNIAAGGAVTSNATASSVTTGGADVTATTDNTFVIGLALGGINGPAGTGPGVSIGGNGSFTLYADNTQNANASATNTSNADPLASAGFQDQTFGAYLTNIVVGQNVNVFQTTGQLDVDATAAAVNGIATASSGVQSNTAGLKDSSLTVGLNANNAYVPAFPPADPYTTAFNPGPISAFTQSEISSSATVTGVTGDAATATSGAGSSSIAIDNSPISVGLNGRVDAADLSQLGATASSNSGAASARVGNSTGANQYYLSSGVYNSDITIGTGSLTPGAGKIASGVTGTSFVNAGASATSNGTDPFLPGPPITGDNADAEVKLLSTGISLGVDPNNFFGNQDGINPPDASVVNNIKIGLEGDVSGVSQTVGSSSASSNAGNAGATASLLGAGIDLEGRSTILIGSKGDISGQAILGSFTAPGTPYGVSATASSGDASAGLLVGLAGIDGNGAATTQLTAGSNTGDVFGAAAGLGRTTATSLTGDATATTNGLGLAGITDSNVTAGLVTTNNLVSGDAFGRFSTTATANNGNANAVGDIDAFGLSGGGAAGNKITVNGNVSGTAFLENIVTANSTSGTATATATSNVIGIDNYSINLIGSGIVNASAGGITQSIVNN